MADTVSMDGYTISSTSETADEMIAALTPNKDEDQSKPRKVNAKGEAEPEKEEEPKKGSKIAAAARELGKKGGKAAAEARKAKAEEDEPEPEKREEPEPEKEEPEPAAPKKREGDPRHDPKARMLEATRKAAELKRQLEAERREREDLRRRVEAMEKGAKPAETEAKPASDRPKPEDFEDYEQYLDARDGWNRKQWDRENQERRQFEERDRTIKGTMASFRERMGKAEAADQTYQERVAPFVVEHLRPSFARAEGEPLTQKHVITDEIIRSEHAAGMLLYLAENPVEFERIAALGTPTEVQIAMAKVEARVELQSREEAPKPKAEAKPAFRPSGAPPPVPPTPRGQAGDPDEIDENASYDEHVRKMNARPRRRA